MSRISIDFLVDDWLELIFKQLREDRCDISSISLVCKRFLTITNRIKTSLNVKKLSAHQFARLLQRYPNLKSINLKKKSSNEVVGFIRQILSSGLELETLEISFADIPCGNDLRGMGMSMKSLKTLYLSPWGDDDLIALTNLFPCIEDLRIIDSLSVSDHGIEVLATKLKRLVKITLINCKEITDQSLKSLSSNGLNFTEITIIDCPKLTENGVGFLLSHSCSMLTSLNLYFWRKSLSNRNHPLTLKHTISYARKLETIRISGNVFICDEVLYSIANSCHTLKRIEFVQSNFTIGGLKKLLEASPFLEYLRLGAGWLTDELMVEISQHLSSLSYIYLNGNSKLTSVTFYTLTERCPMLKTIHMGCTRVGIASEGGLVLGSHKNLRVKTLSLGSNKLMDDNTLVSFCSICPNLESLDLGRCPLLTDAGISKIVKICSKLKFLDVSYLNVSNFLRASNEVSLLKLKIVKASGTKICDEGMKSIGMRCPYLEELTICGCHNVTRDGVEEVVKNCKNIKTIDLCGCLFVSKELMDWIVKTRPSLHIIADSWSL